MARELRQRKPQIVDLAAGVDDSDTKIVQVGKRDYRVRAEMGDATPDDFWPWRFENPLDRRYCIICGYELGNPEHLSVWTDLKDYRCVVHKEPTGDEKPTRPRCVFCGEPMEVVLPFEVPLHQLRYLWVCLERHCCLVSESRDGV